MKKFVMMLIISILGFPVLMAVSQEIPPDKFKITWELIVALVTGIYELLVRLIPTYKHWSIVGKILEILLWISNLLNIKKK